MTSIAYAMGGQGQAAPQGGIGSFLPIILIFVIFYFLLIKPQQKKQKEHQELVKNLKKNDEIVTTGGIHGTIVNLKDKTVVIRIDDNCRMEIQREAVGVIKR